MTQKDYILRIAEDVGRGLAHIIYHKEIHDYQGSLSLIDELFKQTVGASSGFIHAISEEILLCDDNLHDSRVSSEVEDLLGKLEAYELPLNTRRLLFKLYVCTFVRGDGRKGSHVVSRR